MIWKVFKKAGVVDHDKPGSINYKVLKDPRDPDFVDKVTAIIAEPTKEDQSVPSINRYSIVELDDEPRATT